MKKLSMLIIMVVFCSFIVQAQDHIIHGVVNTLDSIPLIGVEIKIQSTKQTIQTDSLGKFVAVCNKEDKLKLTARGFYTENIKVHENIKVVAVNMRLKPGEKQQNYAIGYGYVSAQDKTTPGASMNVNKTDYTRFNNVPDIIVSMGAQVQNGEIILRGGSRSFQGSNGALIVIDDVISEFDNLRTLRPSDIKRIDFLHDPASSVYGSRGTNGVVLIETLKGK